MSVFMPGILTVCNLSPCTLYTLKSDNKPHACTHTVMRDTMTKKRFIQTINKEKIT